jgi:hypothetical protein
MAHAQKPDFVFRRNGRVHLNRRGASVQSTTGNRGVLISGSNAGYTMFWGSVKSTGYPLHSPVSPSLPLPCVIVCHHISAGVYHNSILRSSIFLDVMQGRFVVNDFSGQLIASIFKGHLFFSDCLTLEDETESLSWNVGNYQSTLCNISEERRSHLHCEGSKKWRMILISLTDNSLAEHSKWEVFDKCNINWRSNIIHF